MPYVGQFGPVCIEHVHEVDETSVIAEASEVAEVISSFFKSL